MSLFLVNRYLGEDEDGENASKESRSRALLAKLQQKAKRKQKQQKDLNEEETAKQDAEKDAEPDKDVHAEQDQSSKKRKAKRKDPVEEESVKTKKKKKDVKNKIKVESVTPSNPTITEDVRKNKIESSEVQDSSESIPQEASGFTVLKAFESRAVKKVHRVLPRWLANPDVIRREIKTNSVPVADVPGVSPQMLKKLENNGIKHFFPVQAEVIPAILEGARHGLLLGGGGYRPRDICVSSPTGSGKTLSFVIPVLQVLMERVVCEVRALAVLPTKELAQQVYKVFTSYAEGTPLKVVMLAGQKSFAAEQASFSETRGSVKRNAADVIVATPGRLVDHINKQPALCLRHLRFLIIDEADRMIDSMHQSWLGQVVGAVFSPGEETSIFGRRKPETATAASFSPPQMPLQKLLFSATLTQNPEKLQQLDLHHPRLFSSIHGGDAANPAREQERFDFPQNLTEFYVPCTLSKKPLLILHFILHMKLFPILCFTNSRETAHRLFLLVKLFGGMQAAEFSSRLSPGERMKTLKDFERGKLQLLISTDAAARGIDIIGIKCIVNYDAPQYIRTYVHRVGRTARAGKAGLAFTFLLQVQEKNFIQMLEEAGSPGIKKQIVKPDNLKRMEVQYEQVLQELADVIKGEKTR